VHFVDQLAFTASANTGLEILSASESNFVRAQHGFRGLQKWLPVRATNGSRRQSREAQGLASLSEEAFEDRLRSEVNPTRDHYKFHVISS